MGVDVDGLDPLAADHHRQGLTRCARMRASEHTAAAEHGAGGGSAAFEKITASGHGGALPCGVPGFFAGMAAKLDWPAA